MNPTTLRYDVVEGVATITLDRPQSRNAVNRAMCDEIVAAAAAASEDADLRLVLVRATGAVFCAGADLKERKGMSADEIRARRLAAFAAYGALESLPMPTIAVVQGPAVGSGCEIAACCDFVIATPQATFATPEALWGTIGATQRLPRILGKQLAKDMMFTGRKLTAEEARASGWVTRIVEASALDVVLAEIAKTIVAAPQAALRQAKSCIDQSVELDPRGALALELGAMEENIARETWRAGMSRFGGGKS
ncbi:MAG TPA: enoyl-CoA hydratase/isomerase family protein [Xanthobacteraceae bacterium]|nr:enoyl-CoA hydratase/isomerase family protein [Xanthobacteraceae bacterium]